MSSPIRHFDVDLSGLLRVFGGHLYSTPAVFIRELVQNAADAITERRLHEPDFQGTIVVRADPDASIVEVEDDGIGLDEQGLEEHMSRIGSSSKRDPLGAPRDELIGQFGIGLLSGFLVADRIVLETRKADGAGLVWTALADGTYSVEPAELPKLGTRVRLSLTQEHRAYARPDILRSLLERYVAYLPLDLRFESKGESERISRDAPWTHEDPSGFQAFLEARGESPIFIIPIDAGVARGYAWVRAQRAGLGRARCDLYHHGVLVEMGAGEILPEWAAFCSAVLEARGLSPTASRESFVRDRVFYDLKEKLREILLMWLSSLPDTAPRGFIDFLTVHHLYVKGACLDAPALMDAIGDRIPMETNFGEVDLATFLATSPSERALRYVGTSQEFAHIAPLASARGLGLINAAYVYDEPFIQAFAQRHGIPTEMLDAKKLELFIQPAEGEQERFAHVLAAAKPLFEPLEVEVEIGRFEPSVLPAFLVTDAAQLRERARALLQKSGSPLQRALLAGLSIARDDGRTRFVLNVDNPLVRALPEVNDARAVARAVRLLYAQSVVVLRRTLSLQESRGFSEDLLALLRVVVPVARAPKGTLH